MLNQWLGYTAHMVSHDYHPKEAPCQGDQNTKQKKPEIAIGHLDYSGNAQISGQISLMGRILYL